MTKHHMPVFKLPKGIRLAPPRLDESGSADPVAEWFSSFKDRWRSVRDSWPDPAAMGAERLKEAFSGVFPPEVKARMRYVGTGTTRIVFVSDANVCYKFQYNDWRDQSRHEIAEALAWPGLTCFPKLFDFSKDGAAMAYEVAEAPTREDFVRTFTQGPGWIAKKLADWAVYGERDMLDAMLGSGVLSAPQKKAFLDLMEFQRTVYRTQGRIVDDIDHADNWGKAMREGRPTLIVTDFGL